MSTPAKSKFFPKEVTYPTVSGAHVVILSIEPERYNVRYVETGAIRSIPKEAINGVRI